MSNDKSSKKLGKGTIAIMAVSTAVIVVLVVVIVILVGKMNRKDTSQPDDSQKRNVVVTPDNVDAIASQMAEDDFVAPGSYEVTMNTTWNFENATATSKNAYVANSVANTTDVYFDIVLADTEEKIYSSPVLPIGSHLENISLSKELKAGNYPCVIIYSLIDEDQKVLSEVRVNLTIIIEN